QSGEQGGGGEGVLARGDEGHADSLLKTVCCGCGRRLHGPADAVPRSRGFAEEVEWKKRAVRDQKKRDSAVPSS
ncbi:MAG TPA: hypothetical protein VFW82_14315, partial [Dyella sp.]|nr:hypothetical protein [Dyella sp.]